MQRKKLSYDDVEEAIREHVVYACREWTLEEFIALLRKKAPLQLYLRENPAKTEKVIRKHALCDLFTFLDGLEPESRLYPLRKHFDSLAAKAANVLHERMSDFS